MNELQESVALWYESITPFIESRLIRGTTCAPVSSLVEELDRFGVPWSYVKGAKIMHIAGEKIVLLYGDMLKSHGTTFVLPDDGEAYVAYSQIMEAMAKSLGAGRKEAPFCEALPTSQFLLEHYFREIGKILGGEEQ